MAPKKRSVDEVSNVVTEPVKQEPKEQEPKEQEPKEQEPVKQESKEPKNKKKKVKNESSSEAPPVAAPPEVESSEVSSEKKKKKKKIEKKRKTGTRTPSSYVLFSMEQRKLVTTQSPGLSLGEVSKKCGELWKALNEDDKKVWKDKADVLKQEKLATLPPPEEKKKRKPSNYLCFSMQHRNVVLQNEPGLSLGEVSKRCGEAWKQLSDEEKSSWKDKANEV